MSQNEDLNKKPRKASAPQKISKKVYTTAEKCVAKSPSGQALFDGLKNGSTTMGQATRIEIKKFDIRWINALDDGVNAIDNIVRQPKRSIKTVRYITPIELAKKISAESVTHLASHSQYVKDVTKEGDVIPSKILTLESDDEMAIYENRFVKTLIDRLVIFMEKRYEYISKHCETRDSDVLVVKSSAKVGETLYEYETKIRISNPSADEGQRETNEKLLEKIIYMRDKIMYFKTTEFYKSLADLKPIAPPILKTNIILKNPHYRACLVLWKFIDAYDKIGMNIVVKETNAEFREEYQNQIFYQMLLGHMTLLENKDQEILWNPYRTKIHSVTPRFIYRIGDENLMDDRFHMEVVLGSAGEQAYFAKKPLTKKQKEAERRRELAKKVRDKKKLKKLLEKEKAKEKLRLEKEKAREKARLEKQKALEKERERKQKEKEKLLRQKALEEERKRAARLLEEERIRVEQARKKIEKEALQEQKRLQKEEEKRLKEEEKLRLKLEAEEKKAKEESLAKEETLEEQPSLDAPIEEVSLEENTSTDVEEVTSDEVKESDGLEEPLEKVIETPKESPIQEESIEEQPSLDAPIEEVSLEENTSTDVEEVTSNEVKESDGLEEPLEKVIETPKESPIQEETLEEQPSLDEAIEETSITEEDSSEEITSTDVEEITSNEVEETPLLEESEDSEEMIETPVEETSIDSNDMQEDELETEELSEDYASKEDVSPEEEIILEEGEEVNTDEYEIVRDIVEQDESNQTHIRHVVKHRKLTEEQILARKRRERYRYLHKESKRKSSNPEGNKE